MLNRWDQRGLPTPGSEKAARMGCTCPYWDNHRGRGFVVDGDVVFFVAVGCPLHAPVEDTAPL